MNILYICEYYHIQTRVIQSHIEYENGNWVGFFNFNIALYALYPMLMTAFSTQNSGAVGNPGTNPSRGGNSALGTGENMGLGTVPPDEEEWVAVKALWEREMCGGDDEKDEYIGKLQGGSVEKGCYHDRVIEAYKAYCIKTEAAHVTPHVITPIVYEYVLFASPTDTPTTAADTDDTAMNGSDTNYNDNNNNYKFNTTTPLPTTAADTVSHPATPPQHTPQATSVPVPLITVPALFYQLYQKLLTWQLQYISGQCKPSIQIAMIHNSTVQSMPLSLVEFPPDSYSFHLPLHRFFAVFIEG